MPFASKQAKRRYNNTKRKVAKKYNITPKKANVSASVLQAAVRRTMFKNAESKTSQTTVTDGQQIGHNSFINLAPNNILATTQGVQDPENASAANNRIGDKITLLRAEVRMMLEGNPRYSDITYRILLVKSAKGDTPTTATLFNGLSGNKMLDTINYERYSVIYQKWGKLTARNTGAADYMPGAGYVGSGLLTANYNATVTQSVPTKIVKFNIPGSKFAKNGIIQYEANNATNQKFFDYNLLIYAYSNYTTSEALGWQVLSVNDCFTRIVYKDF